MGVYLFVVYALARAVRRGSAQAGFGIGMRIVQARFMPVVALGFAVAPVAGQNFGAHRPTVCAPRSKYAAVTRRRRRDVAVRVAVPHRAGRA